MIKHGTCPFTGAKLTPEAVRQIRKLKDKKTLKQLSQQFGVLPKQIKVILAGKAWGHVL